MKKITKLCFLIGGMYILSCQKQTIEAYSEQQKFSEFPSEQELSAFELADANYAKKLSINDAFKSSKVIAAENDDKQNYITEMSSIGEKLIDRSRYQINGQNGLAYVDGGRSIK